MAGVKPEDLTGHFPALLKDSDWQKKKGKIGRMVKTGLGAELKKVESLVKKIDIATLDPSANPSKSIEELDKKVALAKAEYQKSIEPLRKQLFVAKSKAEDAAKKLKKKPLGGDAAKAAAAVAREGYQIVSSRVDPQQVRIEGPASILESVNVRLKFSMELRETNEGPVKVVPVFSDETVPEFVRESVRVFPDTVTVQVITEAQVKTLSLDGVRISFRVRMPGVPFNIVSDDFDPVNGTIPVELYGPQHEIERIEEEHKRNVLTLSVPVVRAIQPDQQSIRLFGESDLELYGFPGVQVRQHESRRDKGPWSYRILPTVEADEP